MEAYADATYYEKEYKGSVLSGRDVETYLLQATMHIDVLTFNRISCLDELTPFQKDRVQYCCCKMAEFEYENEDIIQSVLKSYGVNGVSMTFGESWNMVTMDGVAIQRDTYKMLCSTGLCCKVAR